MSPRHGKRGPGCREDTFFQAGNHAPLELSCFAALRVIATLFAVVLIAVEEETLLHMEGFFYPFPFCARGIRTVSMPPFQEARSCCYSTKITPLSPPRTAEFLTQRHFLVVEMPHLPPRRFCRKIFLSLFPLLNISSALSDLWATAMSTRCRF